MLIPHHHIIFKQIQMQAVCLVCSSSLIFYFSPIFIPIDLVINNVTEVKSMVMVVVIDQQQPPKVSQYLFLTYPIFRLS